MKIAILGTRGIPNNYGGFEQFAEFLSVGLVKKGHEVVVYNSHKHPYRKSQWNNVKIVRRFDPESIIGTVGQFIYDLLCIVHSRKQKFDIIYQLGYTSSAIWYNFHPKNSIIVTNMDGLEWKRSKYNIRVKHFLSYSESLAAQKSNHLIADSQGIQQYLKMKYDKNAKYIAYGATIFNDPEMGVLKKYDLQPLEYDLVIARMEPENNIETIIQAFLRSEKKRKLLIIGNIENKFGKYLKKKYKHPKLIFQTPIYDMTTLNNLRYFSNIYFHGHSVGGTNPSLLEAMASHALICAHDNMFNKSILGSDAYYFNDNINSLVGIFNTLLKDMKEEEKILNNLNKIENEFSWTRIIEMYDHYFMKIFNLVKANSKQEYHVY